MTWNRLFAVWHAGTAAGRRRMRMRILGTGMAAGLAASLLMPVTAGAASIAVAPTSVPVGGTVTVSGDVLGPDGKPGCGVPGQVTLISGAFAGQGSFMNMDVETTAGADGRFRTTARILRGVTPGSYTITGRCGGGNLGVQATLVVTPGLPATGDGSGQRDGSVVTPTVLAAALVAAVVGTLLALALSARRPTSA
jgi:hypothetical protein